MIHSLLSFRATDDEYELFRRKMVLPSVPNGRVITACEYEFKAVEGRGRGLFLTEDVKAGDTILLEEPAVIAPKQMSPLVGTAEGGIYGMTFWMKFGFVSQVCVECLVVLPTLDECMFCAGCGVILCEMCYTEKSPDTRHGKECALFVEAGHKFEIRLVGRSNLIMSMKAE